MHPRVESVYRCGVGYMWHKMNGLNVYYGCENREMTMNVARTLAIGLAAVSILQSAEATERQRRALLPIPEKLVVLTFDDGNRSDCTVVADLLKKHGFAATFYITEGLGFLNNKDHYTTWAQIGELHGLGFEIGNHTQHHRNVTRLSREVLTASLRHIEKRCAENAIPKPTTFCYPGFSHNLASMRVVEALGYQFARRGAGPEFADGGKGARGPAYDPSVDHPLLVPTTGYAGPDWGMDDLRWAVEQATDGKIAVLCYHGVPAIEHPWVSTSPEDFAEQMKYLKQQKCTVIAMRDLAKYVDPSRRPGHPYQPINRRVRKPRELSARLVTNPLGLRLNEVALRWTVPHGFGQQTAFQVLVAGDAKKLAADVGDLWDSRRRYSSRHTDVMYSGSPLASACQFWWKVRVWDKDGKPGQFSEPATFKTARQKPPKATKRRATAEGGKPRYVDGRIGKAIHFDDGAAAIRIADYPQLRPTGGTTISAWIKPSTTTDQWQTIFRKEDGNQRRLLSIGRTDDVWGIWIGLGIRGHYREYGAAYPQEKLADGQWHHVAGSFDGEWLRLYVDRKQIGEQRASGPLDAGGGAPAFVGSYDDRREPFHGGIDELRIYDCGLSAEQIAKLATAALSGYEDKIVAWLKLDGNLDNEVTIPILARNRVVLLGNTLISRMAKHGYLEAALVSRWPRHDVTFRNLGWPGDDVFGTARSEFGSARNTQSWQPPSGQRGFGYETLMKQIHEARPTTLIVGYGSQAAFAETPGALEQFETGYANLLDEMESTVAKLVLLSPPRHEKFGHIVPDPTQRNKRLARASAFIGGIAKQRGHVFVDLFGKLKAPNPESRLTDNGIHLNQIGYRRMAKVVLEELGIAGGDVAAVSLPKEGQCLQSSGALLTDFVKTPRGFRFDLQTDRLPNLAANPSHSIGVEGPHLLKIDGRIYYEHGSNPAITAGPDIAQAEQLRQLIVEKNRIHRYRIRPLNKTYIFLFRRHEMGHLAYEMQEFDRLVEAKEELIARLRVPRPHRYEVQRNQAWRPPRSYPDHEVPKNIPMPNIEDELKAFTLPDGFEINLFAKNPMVANPINLNWDTRGRAWVSASSTYPHIKPGREPNDRIVILEDTNHDGRADKSTLFAEGLLMPHSVMPVKGGAYVCSATELLFLADRDGDDRADERRIVYSGFGNADVHHMIHGLRWAPWGELYFTQSIYINSFVETLLGNRRLNGSGIWRFQPETQRLEVFARGMVNPWGHAFDRWGQSLATDGAGGSGPHFVFQDAAFQSAVGAARVLPGLIPGKPKNTAAEFLSGRHVPERWRGSLLANDFRANRTVRYELKQDKSGFSAKEVETVLHSSHRSFRPVDIKMGPDGAVYIVDWYNAIIDHGEVDFHHPQRDKSHGRIWRLTAKGRPLVSQPKIHGAPVAELLEHLKAPEEYTRMQTKRELTGHDANDVLRQLDRWLKTLDKTDPHFEHHRLEALWLHGALRSPNKPLLLQVLASRDPRARAAAVQMVAHWRDKLPDALSMLASVVAEDDPHVRLEAVGALRQVGTPQAADLAMRALDQPIDPNLEYALWLTARHLQDQWIPALRSGKSVFDGKIDRVAFALQAANDQRAVKSLVELVKQKKITGANRSSALRMIAGLGGAEELAYVLQVAGGSADLELLTSLADSPSAGRAVPKNTELLVGLLAHEDHRVRTVTARLVGKWKVAVKTEILARLVDRKGAQFAERVAAASALARLGEADLLKRLATSGSDVAIRTATTAAWAEVDPPGAASSAAGLLAELKTDVEAEFIVRTYVLRDNAPNSLAKALADKKIESSVAIAGIRIARGSGRDLASLIQALSSAGSLKPIGKAMDAQQRAALLSDVEKLGDADRGSAIYTRKSLKCANCHLVGGVGGRVGPDLSAIGAYMTPASILESLVEPSNKIKQGYDTVVIVRNNGTIASGTLQRRSERATLLRDATGKIISVPNSEIEEFEASRVSLMPPGLTASLRRDELVDLLRYLTMLGKQQQVAP